MARTPEGVVKDELRKWLTSKGVWFAGKPAPPVVTGWMYMPVPTGMGVNGIPDFCGVYKALPLYIEAKGPKGELSENQKLRHEEIRKAGGIVIVARSVDELVEGLKANGL